VFMQEGGAKLSALPAQTQKAFGSWQLWAAALTSALGGFLFGYDWVVIGGAKPFYEAHFGVTLPQMQAWVMSCALVGCLLGAIASGPLSERLGRQRTLLIAALAFTASAIGTGSAATLNDFIAWRIAGGIAIGMASVLSPIYIAEVAPAQIRGKLVCLNELTIVLGILAAQIVNWLIADPLSPHATLADLQGTWNELNGWRRMFEAAAIPATVFLVGLFFIPETPRWLAAKGQWDRARAVLTNLGGSEYASEVISQMRSASDPLPSQPRKKPRVGPVLTIGVTLAVLQQWCGINVIFNYAQEVFSAAGYALSAILFNIVITGVTMCVFTFVAIATVERLGRRALMLFGCGSLALIYVLIGWCYHSHQGGVLLLGLIVAAIAAYAMTLAPITWVILSEIFPTSVRGTLMAVCTASLWAACFVLTYSFPMLNASIGTAGTFWFYAGICLAGFFFVRRYLPETKQQSLEAIQRLWQD
jgi:sugar porter (SP) family MFS transporter